MTMMAACSGVLGLFLLAAPSPASASLGWTELKPTTVPPSRTVACFAQVKTGTLMFGGSGPGMLSDTWLWQGGNWHDVSALGGGKAPPGRALGAMAAYQDGAVLFGGYTYKDHSCNDTWVWDPVQGWDQLQPLTDPHGHGASPAAAPSGRSYHSMQATEVGVVLFGGTARTDELHDTALGDTWLFADGGWTNLNLSQPEAPRARWGHSMACTPPAWLEPGAGPPTCTLFGGAALSEDDHFDDTWVWQPMASKDGGYGWQQSQPGSADATPKPAGRWSFQLASCGQGTLMATGSIGYRICTDDTWTFNATVTPSIWTTDKINHDAIGEWTRHTPPSTPPVVTPGYLGGAGLARVNDGDALKGVLLFGGVEFNPGSVHVGPQSNRTLFMAAEACP